MTEAAGSGTRAVTCPHCGSSRVATISFGLPGWRPDLREEAATGRVILGGCCVSRDDSDRYFHECGHHWLAARKASPAGSAPSSDAG